MLAVTARLKRGKSLIKKRGYRYAVYYYKCNCSDTGCDSGHPELDDGGLICGLLLGLAWGITVKTRGMWRMRKLNEQIALLEDDKRILRDKVEQLMKAQGGVMDPADTTTTPAAAATTQASTVNAQKK